MSLSVGQEKQVRNKMKVLVKDCMDLRTGELNCTLLAEITANDLEFYEGDDFTIPERIFEIATEFQKD